MRTRWMLLISLVLLGTLMLNRTAGQSPFFKHVHEYESTLIKRAVAERNKEIQLFQERAELIIMKTRAMESVATEQAIKEVRKFTIELDLTNVYIPTITLRKLYFDMHNRLQDLRAIQQAILEKKKPTNPLEAMLIYQNEEWSKGKLHSVQSGKAGFVYGKAPIRYYTPQELFAIQLQQGFFYYNPQLGGYTYISNAELFARQQQFAQLQYLVHQQQHQFVQQLHLRFSPYQPETSEQKLARLTAKLRVPEKIIANDPEVIQECNHFLMLEHEWIMLAAHPAATAGRYRFNYQGFQETPEGYKLTYVIGYETIRSQLRAFFEGKGDTVNGRYVEEVTSACYMTTSFLFTKEGAFHSLEVEKDTNLLFRPFRAADRFVDFAKEKMKKILLTAEERKKLEEFPSIGPTIGAKELLEWYLRHFAYPKFKAKQQSRKEK